MGGTRPGDKPHYQGDARRVDVTHPLEVEQYSLGVCGLGLRVGGLRASSAKPLISPIRSSTAMPPSRRTSTLRWRTSITYLLPLRGGRLTLRYGVPRRRLCSSRLPCS